MSASTPTAGLKLLISSLILFKFFVVQGSPVVNKPDDPPFPTPDNKANFHLDSMDSMDYMDDINQQENMDNSTVTIVIVVVAVVLFILLGIFNHVIIPKVRSSLHLVSLH